MYQIGSVAFPVTICITKINYVVCFRVVNVFSS